MVTHRLMSRRTHEVNEKVEEGEGKASKFVEFLGKVLNLFENIPKAVAGVAIIISLVAGTTGAWGAMTSPEKKEVSALEQKIDATAQRVHDLEIWNRALRERTVGLIGGSEKVEFDGYMLDVNSGDIQKLVK